MKVADVMTRYVEFLGRDATTRDAATMMGELDVGGLPVGDAAKIDGIVTDRDILFRVVASGLDCGATPIADVMSRPVVSCMEDDTVQSAMEAMAAHHIRRMPVMDADRQVTGWVTLADLSRKLLLESGQLQAALQELGAAEATA